MRLSLCLLPLLLASCVPTTSAGLRSMAADLDAQQAAQRQAEQERQAYEQAQRDEIAQQTAQAIQAEWQRLAVTQTAQQVDALATQAAIVAEATRQAAQIELDNHRAELELAQRRAINDEALDTATKWIALFVASCIALILTVLTVTFILTRFRIDNLRYERWLEAVRELPAGEMTIDAEEVR